MLDKYLLNKYMNIPLQVFKILFLLYKRFLPFPNLSNSILFSILVQIVSFLKPSFATCGQMRLDYNRNTKELLLLFFRERGRGAEREGDKHQCVVASHTPPTGNLAWNPSVCPDWESNRWPFGLQVSTQSTEPHQPGQELLLTANSQNSLP